MDPGYVVEWLVKLGHDKRWGRLVAFFVALGAPMIAGCVLEASTGSSLGPGEWVGAGGIVSLAVLAAGPLVIGRAPADLLLTAGTWAGLEVALALLWPTAVASSNAAIETTAVVLLGAAYLVWVVYWWHRSRAPGTNVSPSHVTGEAAFLLALAAWNISDVVVLRGGNGMGFAQAGKGSSPPWVYPLLVGLLELGFAAARAQYAAPQEPSATIDREPPAPEQAAAGQRSDRVAQRVLQVFYVLIGVGGVVSLSPLVVPDALGALSQIGLAVLIAAFGELLVGLGIAAYLSRRADARREA